ncbi:WD repeat-containing protein WDS homolog isoform X2 [Lolium rigidum]|uniref:WD repeat-containing protein WDS homolog isoform X2 n=1 Tax=Lolium rigidum TaxID=89674 RepID=UPI001F5DB0BD|nr:WD repeat-containing protein WDS homolog isoform X2 [Lolium rigidum]
MDQPESSVSHAAAQTGPTPRRLGARSLVDRDELVRVIAQSLYSLGYPKAAAALEAESGVPLYPPEHDRLLLDVMSGRWDACAATIDSLAGVSERNRAVAEFLVWRGHFLELLGTGDDGVRLATEVLWRRIAPLGINRKCVHWLARAMVSCEGAVPPEAVAEWRIGLFLDLVEALPPWFRVPSGRLEHLVETAVIQQVASCIYHNLPDEVTLFEDHNCHDEQVPSDCTQILCAHKNEVWFVKFSNDGNYLASSSSDCTAIIWKVAEDDTLTKKYCLEGHKSPISFVAWSPNDKMLLTCGNGESLKLWNMDTGECNLKFGASVDHIISSCAWFPNSEKIVCASSEPESSPNMIFTCDLEGRELEMWAGERIPKVSDLAVTPDGQNLICVCPNEIWIRELRKGREWKIPERQTISSLSLSGDGQSMIVNLNSQEIHLWKTNGSSSDPDKFKGHKQGKFVIRSCFGGSDSLFIASGSEDSQRYYIKPDTECETIGAGVHLAKMHGDANKGPIWALNDCKLCKLEP